MDITSSSTDRVPTDGLVTASCADRNAYLIVHANATDQRGRRGAHAPTPLERLRALYQPNAVSSPDAPLSLALADGHGRTVLSLPDASPVLGVALAPGTYHLTATRGQTRRGYTVSLPAGTRFELHLQFAASDPPKQAPSAPPRSTRSAD